MNENIFYLMLTNVNLFNTCSHDSYFFYIYVSVLLEEAAVDGKTFTERTWNWIYFTRKSILYPFVVIPFEAFFQDYNITLALKDMLLVLSLRDMSGKFFPKR